MLKNSFYIWQISGRQFDVTQPPPAAISFVECATLIDLIDNKNIQKEVNKGKSMKLAELSIDYGYPRTPEANSITLRNRASECMRDSQKEIANLYGKHDFRIGERGKNAALVANQYRNRIEFGSGRRNSTPGVTGF